MHEGERFILEFSGQDWWVMEVVDGGTRRAFNAGRDPERANEALQKYIDQG
jgi:hypothetical protein